MARCRFTKEFKISVVQELETSSLAVVCRAHSLDASTVCGWRKDYEKNPKEAFSGHGKVWKQEAKIAHYERLVGELYAQVDFLKKAYEQLQARKAEERKRRSSAP